MIKWPECTAEKTSSKSTVAWRAQKKVFLFKTEASVGINDHIHARVISQNQNKQILVKIPVHFFNSGDQIRDEKVVFLLSCGDKYSDIEFKSNFISESDWLLLVENQLSEISGQLKIGDIERMLTWSVRITKSVNGFKAEGQSLTTLSNFNIKPPSLFFGLAAQVLDQISLHFSIYEKDIVDEEK